MHSASATEHSEVSRAGFQTTALPAASAGAISSAGIVYGQFQGVMTPTTPFGNAVDEDPLLGSTDGGSRPSIRVASAAAIRKYRSSSSTSPYASATSGLPWSSVSARASSSRRRSMVAAIRSRAAARSNGEVRPHAPAARAAASIARRRVGARARGERADDPARSPGSSLRRSGRSRPRPTSRR